MKTKLEFVLQKNQLFTKKNTFLLAISGGVDSVVLAHLLKKNNCNFYLAHCNFKLRGKESDADQAFCENLAKKLNVKIFVSDFEVSTHRLKNNLSIQMAARNLRYQWFTKLLQENQINYLLTAHHLDDSIETFFINLLRGTGINGLKGIAYKKDNLIRPLIEYTKKEIETYADKEKIKFRQDKSNFKKDYKRNFLRLDVIPKLKNNTANFENIFYKNFKKINQDASIVNDYLESRVKQISKTNKNITSINKLKLISETHLHSILNYILRPYKFNESNQKDIITHLETNSVVGKIFFSPSHKLIIDRKNILIKLNKKNDSNRASFNTLNDLINEKNIQVIPLKKFIFPKKNELIINKKRLIFPLKIRTKQTGDKFKPFGMKGFKLLSEYFKNQKLNVFEKENTKILVNGNEEIIWIIGFRSDERYRVNEFNKDLIKIKYIEKEN